MAPEEKYWRWAPGLHVNNMHPREHTHNHLLLQVFYQVYTMYFHAYNASDSITTDDQSEEGKKNKQNKTKTRENCFSVTNDAGFAT